MLNLIFIFVVAGILVTIVASVLMALWVEDIDHKTKAIKLDVQHIRNRQEYWISQLNSIEQDGIKIHKEVLEQRALLEENIIEVEDE